MDKRVGPSFTVEQCWEFNNLSEDRSAVVGLEVIPLGGFSEIAGPNSILLRYDGHEILLDCGKKVSENFSDMLPVNPSTRVFPNFRFVHSPSLSGVFISHGHYDHLAAIPMLVREKMVPSNNVVDVFGSATSILVSKKIFSGANLSDWETNWVNYHPIDESSGNGLIEVGPFKVMSFPVCHSIPGSLGFLISVGGRNVCYLGDFKYLRSNWRQLEETEARFQEIGRQLVDVLIVDTTNVDVNGFTPSTSGVIDTFAQIFQDPDMENRRIIVATFASDVEIIEEIACVARNIGKRPITAVGTSMRFFFEQFGITGAQDSDKSPVVFVTGHQAEPGSALPRMIDEGSVTGDDIVIFSAKKIPGNHRRINEMIGKLREIAYKVFDTEDGNFHVSGHAASGELLKAVEDILPRIVVPCHGNFTSRRRLANTIFKSSMGRKPDVSLIADGVGITI